MITAVDQPISMRLKNQKKRLVSAIF